VFPWCRQSAPTDIADRRGEDPVSVITFVVRLAVGAATCTALSMPVAAGAATPLRETFPSDFTFTIDDMCPFSVDVHAVGSLSAAAFTANPDGLITHEVDHYAFAFTYTGPTGSSATAKLQEVVLIDYGSGAQVGSAAVVKITGLLDSVIPGTQANAGQLRFNAVVTGFDDNGVPLSRLVGDPVKAIGSFPDTRDTSVFCARLS
jgi:hypothetical protein